MKAFLPALLLVALLAQASVAQEPRGFAEGRIAAFPGASGTSWQLVERVRPTFQSSFSDRLKFVTAIEAGLAQGRHTPTELERLLREGGLGDALDAGIIAFPEYRNQALRVNRSADYLDVDRLYLDYYGQSFDLRVGRQALNWGSGQFFNPTDPFPEVLLAEPWRPRRGVNAVRVNVPFLERSDLSAVVASNDALDAFRAAGRVRTNWKGTDFALVGAWRGDSDSALLGVDLRGTLGVGWWVEAAWILGSNPHEEISVGIDYSFPILERATVMAQYYRNGAGSTAGGVPGAGGGIGGALLPSGDRDPFAPFVSGRDYLLLGTNLVILPELTAGVFVLQNLNDGSGMAIPTVSWNVLDWLDVAASGQVAFAFRGSGEFRPGPDDLRLQVPSPTNPGQTHTVDLRGLVPAATLTLWTRASF